MEIRFSKDAMDAYQKLSKEGQYFYLGLMKCGCCGYSFSMNQGRANPEHIRVTISIPAQVTDSLESNLHTDTITYVLSDNIQLPITQDAKTFLKNVQVEYNNKGFFNKGFKVYPNQF